MTGLDLRTQLDDLFSTANERYSEIKESAESAVTRWEWSTAERFTIEPYGFEMNQLSRGRVLKDRPTDINYKFECGYDKDNRPVVERQYVTFSGGREYKNEEFWIYDVDSITIYRYPHDESKKVVSVKRAILSQGHLTSLGQRFDKQFRELNYEYVDSSLKTVTERRYPLDSTDPSHRRQFRFQFDHAGLQSIELGNLVGDEGLFQSQQFVYRRPVKNLKARKDAILAELEAGLTREIQDRVKTFKSEHGNEDWYAFMLTYELEGTYIDCAFGTLQAPGGKQYNPWEGYYFYPFDADKSLKILTQGFEEQIFTEYGRSTPDLCTKVLKKLDENGVFGTGEERNKIAIGLAVGLQPSIFEKSALKLNPETVVKRLKGELKR
jgi:hypothetical protein